MSEPLMPLQAGEALKAAAQLVDLLEQLRGPNQAEELLRLAHLEAVRRLATRQV
jgi:hypothetical protein